MPDISMFVELRYLYNLNEERGTECLCAFSISRYTFGSECILKFSQHFATIIMPYYNENAIPSVLTPKSKCI